MVGSMQVPFCNIGIMSYKNRKYCIPSLVGDLNLPRVDSINDIVGWLAIDGATNRLSSPEHLLDGPGKVFS